MLRSLLVFIRNAASAVVGLVFVLPWIALSVVGAACLFVGDKILFVADAIERFKDFLQTMLYCSRIPPRKRSRTSCQPK